MKIEITININNARCAFVSGNVNNVKEVSAAEVAEKLGACDEGIEWLQDNNIETFQQAWELCPRGDWLLWLAANLGVELRPLTSAKAACAATVEHLMNKDESLRALEVARQFGLGRATRDQMRAVSYDAARAAGSAASYAAASAAHVAADPDAYAADAAADAALAAFAAAKAADADAEAARKEILLVTANICRQMLTEPVMKKISERFG